MKKLLLIVSVCILVNCEMEDIDLPGKLVPPTVDQDPLLPSFEINGTTLHLETFGDINNPIIIFLHGGPGGDYRAMISEFGEKSTSRYPAQRLTDLTGLTRLQDDYFLIFYDQRSAGLSQRHDKVSFEDYLDDLDGIIDFYLQEKRDQTGNTDETVHLFAWSFGGILATGYVNRHPDKVADLVFYEPGPFSKEVWDYFKSNTTSVFAQVGMDWLEEFLLSKDHFTPDSHERADYQLLINVFRAQPEFNEHPDTPLWRFGALLADDNLDFSLSEDYDITSNIASSFTGNTLFIAGSLTVSALPDYMGLQMIHYPNVIYHEISNTGHTGPWEKPDEIADQIRNFLQ